MKLLIFALTLLSITASCKKNNTNNSDALQGVWVETTLRLDTLDFEINNLIYNNSGYAVADFKTNRYTDTVLNPTYPVTHSTVYNYYFTNGQTTINMRSFLSSFSGFGSYKFSMAADGKQFTVDKFYGRRSLPSSVDFIRIR